MPGCGPGDNQRAERTGRAAGSLAALLAQSVSDRDAVNAAYHDVMGCGANLSGDTQVFDNAAASRSRLPDQLASLPSQFTLPAQMLQELSAGRRD